MLLVPGGMALLSVPVAFVFQEYTGVEALLVTATICLLLGGIARYAFPHRRITLSIAEVMWVATLGWVLVSLAGAIPFFYLAHRLSAEAVALHQLAPFADFLNATFESVSGYTSTGLTVTPSESSLPRTLQWWRSFLQWVGGIGIIVFISALHPGLSSVSAHYDDPNEQKDEDEKQPDEEEENDEEQELLPNVEVSWTKVWWIYLAFSLAAIGGLWVQDIPLWEAINHGMTAISTGGFNVTGHDLRTYSGGPKWWVIFIIIAGSLNFHLLHRLLTRRAWRTFLGNPQHQLFAGLLVIGPCLLYYENNVRGGPPAAWTDLVFQFTSALGTCGFATVKVSQWTPLAWLVLTAAMLVGGATASTTGGIKLFRLILLVKGNLYGLLAWISDTNRPLHLRFNDRVFSHEESLRLYRNVGVFFFFWTSLFVVTVLVLLHEVGDRYGLAEVLFESASALGTVGLSVGITSHELSALAKLGLTLAMLVGRLELMPIVVLAAYLVRGRA